MEFIKVRKTDRGMREKLEDAIRVNRSSIVIAQNVAERNGAERGTAYIKFDVSTDGKTIRVRKGQRKGSRSFSLSQTNSGNGRVGAYGCNTPKGLKDLVRKGTLRMGTYKLTEGDLFVKQ